MTACFDVESLVDDMIAASVGTEQGNGYVGENQLKPMKIHSKWYDMSGFDHPGGFTFLQMGEGRDASAMFEAHHPFTNRVYLEKILAKHQVDPAKVKCELYDRRDEDAFFNWPAYETKDESEIPKLAPVSEFAHELRQEVQKYFEKEAKRRGVPLMQAIKATPARWALMLTWAAIFVATLPSFFAGEYWTLIGTPFTYWIMGVNTFHDGSHSAVSRSPLVNTIATYTGWWFSSPLEWYHQHVIGHHAYPNIPKRDPDLYHNNLLERHTKTLRHKPMHTHQASTFYPIWFMGTFFMNYAKPIQMFMSGYYNRAVAMVRYSDARLVQHILGRFFVFALCHVWPFFVFNLAKAFLFSFFPVGVVSVCFMFSSQVNHLTPQNIDVSDTDYYKHQVLTSHSFGGTSRLTAELSLLFTGGLSLQIEHHLFPTVNHCHLKALQPTIKKICEKHKVPYHWSSGFREALSKYVAHLKEMSVAEIIVEHLELDHDH